MKKLILPVIAIGPLFVGAIMVAVTLTLPACTSLKIKSDGSGKYQNGIFQKQLNEMSYSKSGSNVTLTMKGYRSDAGAVIQGLEIMRQAYTGQQPLAPVPLPAPTP